MLSKWLQSSVDRSNYTFPSFLFFYVAIDSVFDENSLQGSKMPLLFQFIQLDFQFLFEQLYCSVGTSSEHFRNSDKQRFVVFNHTTQRRNRSLACRKGVERINSFIW